MDEYSKYRKQTQDLKHPNSGCMFRNPKDTGVSAGEWIDKSGLKGKAIGGAAVSDIHANFIVNRGHASFSDVMELLKLVEQTVWSKFNVKLEREIKVLS